MSKQQVIMKQYARNQENMREKSGEAAFGG
jgi:hypothetical protein